MHVNGVAVKPGREVGPGDELELALGPVRWTVIVRGAVERRVSAAEAASLYDETEESVAERERQAELRRLAGPVDLCGGRPSATAAATRQHRPRWRIGTMVLRSLRRSHATMLGNARSVPPCRRRGSA